MQLGRVLGVIAVAVGGGIVAAQEPAKVDFARDVQPVLQEQCVGCHGPVQQMGGLRLDRRHDALRGATMGLVIRPGNSAGSKLYRMIAGELPGQQMPPGGRLSEAQVRAVKTWIDEGAVWPDALSGETSTAAADPQATRLLQALRAGDARAIRRMLQDHPEAVKRQGAGGTTPLMYASLYGDLDTMRRLLDAGADVNAKNDAGATALMWAVDDIEKTRLLLARGANANARSFDGRTPLFMAAGRFGSSPVLRLLIDRGASVTVKARGLVGEMTPLAEAVYAGDAAAVALLLTHGAQSGAIPLAITNQSGCDACFDLLAPLADRATLDAMLPLIVPPFGNATRLPQVVARGASPTATDRAGRSLLMLASASEAAPADVVQMLVDRGADVRAASPGGETPLMLALRHGRTPVVEVLEKAGAVAPSPTGAAAPAPAGSPREAVARSLPLLVRTGETFLDKSGCVSCHNNTLLMMTVTAARANGVAVDDTAARAQTERVRAFIETWRERMLQGIGIPGDADTVSYILHGLAAEQYAPDAATDAMARYVKRRQMSDGRWAILGHRPPIESTDMQVTALAIRGLRVYAPAGQRAEYEAAARRGAAWLAGAPLRTTEDRVFRLFGLRWADAPQAQIRAAADDLLALQKPDGSWAQLPTLGGDAYATGEALVALYESGAIGADAPAYRRGVAFLLGSQYADGSWLVRTRAIPLQPLFDIGFPHGNDSWISAAATNWAATALAYAAQPAPGRPRTSRAGGK